MTVTPLSPNGSEGLCSAGFSRFLLFLFAARASAFVCAGKGSANMAFQARFLAFLMLICISQVSSIPEQMIDPAIQLLRDGSFKELQKKIRYEFQDEALLVRAMTHSSFSFDNNGVLNIVGSSIIQVATSLHYVLEDSSITKGNLSSVMAEVSKACLDDAVKLELPKLIRVAPKVDPKSKMVACSCYHALFGAIAVDSKSPDVAEAKFWDLHGWSSPPKVLKGSIFNKKAFIR